MELFWSIISKTCPSSFGWGCMLWPIFFPAVVAIVIMIVWWLASGAKIKSGATKKDYSIVFIAGSIALIAVIGIIVYWVNKIPQ